MGLLPNKPSRCKWSLNADPFTSPHHKRAWERDTKIYQNVLESIGNTPLIKLNKLPEDYGLKCDVYAKCEFFNPGCSIKDRIAYRTTLDAEENGVIGPGTTIIEPSTGNTGVSFAMVSALKGYRCIVVMQEKTSPEKMAIIKALGSEVVVCPSHVNWETEESAFGKTHTLLKEIDNSVNLDQFSNPGNPLAHYDQTAEEILDALNYEVDMFIAGCGTGGTLTGIGRKFKEVIPDVQIVAADPDFSELARPDSLNRSANLNSEIEGIGIKILTPTILDHNVIDKWIKISDKECFVMARRLLRDEGLFCGGTGGASLVAAVQAAKHLEEGKKVVIMLPDSVRFYLGRYARASWMAIRQYELCPNPRKHWWWDFKVTELTLTEPNKVKSNISCHRALHELYKNDVQYLPVVSDDGNLLGVISRRKLELKLIYETVTDNDPVQKAMVFCDIPKVEITASLGVLTKALELDEYCVIYQNKNAIVGTIKWPIGLVTAFDVLHYIATHPNIMIYGAI